MHRTTFGMVKISLLTLVVAGAAAIAQPATDRPADRAGDRQTDRAADRGPRGPLGEGEGFDREALRERLEQARATIDDVIAKIDAGEPMGTLFSGLAPLERLGGLREAVESRRRRGGDFARERDGAMGFGPPRPPEARDDIPDPTREQMLTFLKDKIPMMHDRYERAKEADAEAADRMLDRLEPRVVELWRLEQQEPGYADLRIAEIRAGWEVVGARRALGEAMASGDSARIDQARSMLREALSSHFDARLAVGEQELRRLEAETTRLRAEIEDKRRRRGELVDEKITEFASDIDRRGERGRRDRRQDVHGDRDERP